jgi:hypothetical protein
LLDDGTTTHDMTANSRGLIYDLNVTQIRSILTHMT